ncbi:MAG: DUF6089 family protein [Bacteroidales bacterium]|nr:DUF6089 family protein [Bacteroidales bacterium]
MAFFRYEPIVIRMNRTIVLIFLLFSCCATQIFAQRRDVDFGLLLGTAQYNGDVNMTKAYTSPQLAAEFMFRKNFNPHYSLRLNLAVGTLKANDENFKYKYQQLRDYYFDDTKLMEFSGMVEFNFFEVTTNKKEKNFSPYTVFGLGIIYNENIPLKESLTIPMGLGLKYKIHPRLELRTEWTFRKTYTDKLDQLAYQANDGFLQYKQISFKKTKDWFSILGISLLFNFSDEKIPCPIYEPKSFEKRRR